MAKTQISDVIIPSKFNQYVIERTAQLSALWSSGIVGTNPELNALARGGGNTINMPYWKDLTGGSQVLSDTGALTVNKITAGQDVAVLNLRGNAWSSNDLAYVMAGDDPAKAIGDLVSDWWARDMQTTLLSVLGGAFTAASMSTNIHDISAGAGAAAVISGAEFLNAKQKLGDAAGKLTAIMMHSLAYTTLQQQNLIEFIPDAEGKVNIPTYMGYRVIVDDGCPQAAGVFTSYLFGTGAIGYGDGLTPYPVEFDRDKLAGDDIIINRRSFILHPRGIKWKGSATGAAPTNAELATGTNWERVYEAKNIRIVQFKYKLASA